MAQINEFQSNIAVYNGVTYVASLNNANSNVTIGNVVVTSIANATSNTSGAVTVVGGVSVFNGNLAVSGAINSYNGPAISASYPAGGAGQKLAMLPGDIVYASSDVNTGTNFPNVTFGTTFTISGGSPSISVYTSTLTLPDGTYKFFGSCTPGTTSGAGLYRRIS